MPANRLATLRILKANWNAGRSWLDNFLPFVAECLRTSPSPSVTLTDVREAMLDNFGMRVPTHVLGTILNRAAKAGLVVKGDRRYTVQAAALSKWALPAGRNDLLRCHAALIDQLVAFASERFGRQLTVEEVEAALDAYVSDYVVHIAACPGALPGAGPHAPVGAGRGVAGGGLVVGERGGDDGLPRPGRCGCC